jgi:hypothetical protein
LWASGAHNIQADFAANQPEGRWASGLVDEVGEHGLDDRVLAASAVGSSVLVSKG